MRIKLSRVLKILSVILIAVGIVYLFLFVLEQDHNVTDILDQPSYYVIHNYRMLFLSGIAAVACSVLGSFFSWSEKIDPQEQVLINAGYATAESIDSLLKGSAAEESNRIRQQTLSQPFTESSTVSSDSETSRMAQTLDGLGAGETELTKKTLAAAENIGSLLKESGDGGLDLTRKQTLSRAFTESSTILPDPEISRTAGTLDGLGAGQMELTKIALRAASQQETLNSSDYKEDASLDEGKEGGFAIAEILEDEEGSATTESPEDDRTDKEADA